jgi:predicted subunit of tRNA(5-methylaminomethyl-2-thiouridylate) methyltransferase
MILEEGDLVAIKEFYFTSPDKRTRSYAIVIEAGWKQSKIRVIHNGAAWWIANNELKLLSGGSRPEIEKV